jgi:hypothetical protein
MILQICRWALWLDEWLQSRLGRPYNIVLGVGLISEIVSQIGGLAAKLQSAPNIARAVLVLAVEFALLVHQVGALSHHIERREARKAGVRRGRTHT